MYVWPHQSWRRRLSDTDAAGGKVVVNRVMSLDGFIAGPGDAMDWIFEFVTADYFREQNAQAAGALLVGRRTYEVGRRINASGGYYISGPTFVITHEPPSQPDPSVTFLTGDIGDAVAVARQAAGDRNVEIIGADVAGQCLQRGLVDEILVYVLPVLLGDGVRLSPPGLGRVDLEPVTSTQAGAATVLRFRVRKRG
jgi:dihydrofolate reductase